MPAWNIGDRWEFRWKSPRGSGAFTWRVDRIEAVDGEDYYVVKANDAREIYRRTRDQAYLMDKVAAGIETRYEPPDGAPWPLQVGMTWERRYTRHRPLEKKASAIARRCRVESTERLVVPAGTFETLRFTCHDAGNDALAYEAWFAPAVKHWVKERARFDDGFRERELTAYTIEGRKEPR
jgi:hypothetical protein